MPHAKATPVLGRRPRTARELGIMQGFPPPPEKRPTLTNWDLPPFNRWSFQNVRSLVPTVDVFRGTGPVRPLPEAADPLGDLAVPDPAGGSRSLDDFLEESYTDGFLVMHRGRVVFERYLNAMGPAALHLSQSVSKSVTGLLAGAIHAEGRLDLDAPLAGIVPELSGCGYAEATLSQVLDMRSGVRFSEDYNAPHSDMTRIDIASGWRPARANEARPTIRDVILSLPQIRPHGGAFDYRSIETDVVAWVLERVTGEPLAELLSRHVWQRIGAERDAYFTVDTAGTALADGGFNATLRDFARIGLLLLNEGRVEGAQIVPRAWIETMRQGDPSVFGAPYTAIFPRGAYRRFWWIRDADRGDICARGVFGQLIYVDPDSALVVVKLSTWPDYVMPQLTHQTFEAIDAIRAALQ
ncbi:serine hydrolase domain-containing protein [Limimaricola pyoseonensis]|uniref:CubicO group peptidase, beta-lactamase class C family n=1 Tax=Limimaricola pyoseonensis TaxID=521013 RepID=A0A1G7IIA0_9RHOB|nr:serine hydrolase [Limimaricola pyoseonensis]SDF12451.1 CubicO group peptidase, beta-lactamase class C family [Limimaricola pyoseonensis]